jgi:hypothetical protein
MFDASACSITSSSAPGPRDHSLSIVSSHAIRRTLQQRDAASHRPRVADLGTSHAAFDRLPRTPPEGGLCSVTGSVRVEACRNGR